jgi:hypothetical protein
MTIDRAKPKILPGYRALVAQQEFSYRSLI